MTTTEQTPVLSEAAVPNVVNALDLYNQPEEPRPFLLEGWMPQGQTALLFGSSDVGKSMLARDFALHIVLGKDSFIGKTLNPVHRRVLYVSTEDDAMDWKSRLQNSIVDKSCSTNLEGLDLMFPDGKNTIPNIYKYLLTYPTDLLVVDVATDFPIGNINDTDAVRKFFFHFKVIARQTGTSVLMLHHVAKGREGISKDHAIGSQAWTSGPRAAWMLSRDGSTYDNNGRRLLTLVKANHASDAEKSRPICLKITDRLSFEPVLSTSSLDHFIESGGKKLKKTEDPALIEKILELKESGLTLLQIVEELKEMEITVGKTTVSNIIREHQKNGELTEAEAA
ncbi:AAA family ATPase [Paracnuella aquatica]|uniref:AAA family ATPase n=1 Tax=Paracnuella aquatica TaxID=2268757 RepID=UPI000DEF7D63|nr:AAA family ATPase [Paracnuella aquatica]RPD51412.1 AAA family ATPase [Paracnuella aquatica]